jgi:hypothetical protein
MCAYAEKFIDKKQPMTAACDQKLIKSHCRSRLCGHLCLPAPVECHRDLHKYDTRSGCETTCRMHALVGQSPAGLEALHKTYD